MPAGNQSELQSPLRARKSLMGSETKCTPLTPMLMDFSPGHTPVMVNLEKSSEFGGSSNPYQLRVRESTPQTPRDISPSTHSFPSQTSENFGSFALDDRRNFSERTQPTQLKPVTSSDTPRGAPPLPSRSSSRTLIDANSRPRGRNSKVPLQHPPSRHRTT